MGHLGKNRAKSIMRCNVYGLNMDRDIAYMIESCKGCALAAKSLTTTCKRWPNTDHPWQRIHVDFAEPVDNMYYLIVVDSHSKWLEVLQCKRPTNNCTIEFLHELFARFAMVDCVVYRQRHSIDIMWFQRLLQHVSSGPHYNASVSPQIEWSGLEVCGHPEKRALEKVLGTPTDRALQQFLLVYRITHNLNTPMGRSPAETMFARKIKSVFDRLIPRQAKFKKTVSPHKKCFYPGDKIFFKAFKNNMTFRWVGTIKQRIGELVYIVQGQKNTHKRHMNQLRKCRLNESEESPQNACEEPIE